MEHSGNKKENPEVKNMTDKSSVRLEGQKISQKIHQKRQKHEK